MARFLNKLFVGLKKNNINVILKFACVSVYSSLPTTCSENVPLVDELVRCRAKAVHLLGYGSYAEHTIQGRMLDIC